MKLKSGDQLLIYIENSNRLSDVSGSTCRAKYFSSIQINNETFHQVIQLTGLNGEDLETGRKIIISEKNILNLRPKKNLKFQFYHIDYSVTARDFVYVKNKSRQLERTSKFGLGSGIQGVYLKDSKMIPYLMTEANQKPFEIQLSNPFIIQDREHGESLSLASVNLNRFIDQLLKRFNNILLDNRNNINLLSDGNIFTTDILDSCKTVTDQIGYSIKNYHQTFIESLPNEIRNSLEKHIVNQWTMVFDRTDFKIDENLIIDAIYNFVVEFINKLTESDLDYRDSITQNKLIEQPINFIMKLIGIDGLIADDEFNNGWDRFCISYNFDGANEYYGSETDYYDL